MKTTHNTQSKKTTKDLIFIYILYILFILAGCMFPSCSPSKCCTGVQSKKSINKAISHKSNFIKKKYNL